MGARCGAHPVGSLVGPHLVDVHGGWVEPIRWDSLEGAHHSRRGLWLGHACPHSQWMGGAHPMRFHGLGVNGPTLVHAQWMGRAYLLGMVGMGLLVTMLR